MLRFENADILYALLLIPLFWGMFRYIRYRRKNDLLKLGESKLINQLHPLSSRIRPAWKFMLLMLAFAALIIGIANPQIGSKLKKVQREGIDLMVALDVSNSMLAEDIKPNRLESAKLAISKLIDRLEGDRIGIVVFAGKAYLQLPITTDYAAAKLFLSTIDTRLIPSQGTAIGEAINKCLGAFDENEHEKAIVIITDGENHEDDAIGAANMASERGIKIYTIGMGLNEGAPIPIYQGDTKRGYKKDRQGNTILTRLNETMMQQVAAAGNGKYVGANNTSNSLNLIYEEINAMEKTEIESKVYSDYEDRFQYFIAIAIVLLMLEIIIVERKGKWAGRFKLFE